MKTFSIQITIILLLLAASSPSCFALGKNGTAMPGFLALEGNGFLCKTSMETHTTGKISAWGLVAIDTQEQESAKNWGVDFHLLGTSVHLSKKIKGRFYLGMEVGILPDVFSWTVCAGENFSQEYTVFKYDKDSPQNHYNPGQVVFFHLFGRLDVIQGKFGVDVGIRRARFSYFLAGEDRFLYPLFHGGYIKPTLCKNKMGAGFRLDLGVMSQSYGSIREFVVLFNQLIRFKF